MAESSWVQRGNSGRLEVRTLRRGAQYIDGTVRTPYGIVEVLGGDNFRRFDVIHKGRHVSNYRDVAKPMSRRALTAEAGRFAKRSARAR